MRECPGGVRVELHDGPDRCAWLGPAWERLRSKLAARGMTTGPYLAHDWLAVFARELASTVGPPRTLVAWRDGELVGVLPLLRERRRLAHVPAHILRSLSDDHSQRWDALIADAEVARALMDRLLQDRGWDALELRDVADGPSGAGLLADAARAAGCIVGDWPAQRSPVLELPSDPAALRLDAKFRANLRRRARRLAEDIGPLSLERVTDPAALDAALDEAVRLEAAGWKGAAGTAIAGDPVLVARYRALAHAFAARGALALMFLRAGDRRVAFHFAIEEEGTYYLFKVGSDPRLARYGLGHLLVDAVTRDLIARGARALDFLGDVAEWKREWTETTRATRWLYVFRPTLFGRVLAAWKLRAVPTLKRAAKELGR